MSLYRLIAAAVLLAAPVAARADDSPKQWILDCNHRYVCRAYVEISATARIDLIYVRGERTVQVTYWSKRPAGYENAAVEDPFDERRLEFGSKAKGVEITARLTFAGCSAECVYIGSLSPEIFRKLKGESAVEIRDGHLRKWEDTGDDYLIPTAGWDSVSEPMLYSCIIGAPLPSDLGNAPNHRKH